jgi:hypothetical protein
MLESAWKLILAGAGPGLQNQRAVSTPQVGSTPTSFRQLIAFISSRYMERNRRPGQGSASRTSRIRTVCAIRLRPSI